MLEYLFIIVAICFPFYVFLVFFASRLIVPFLGYKPFPRPLNIPPEIADAIKELEDQSIDPRSYLEAAYSLVRNKWHGGRFKTLTHLHLAFRTDLQKIWNDNGFAQCHTINYMLFVLLVESKYFTPEDIKVEYSIYNLFIHQYLKVKINNVPVDVDVSITYKDWPVGRHAEWFG